MKIVPCSVTLRKVDGTELDIVNAARVSFHKESEWEYEPDKEDQMALNKVLSARDIKLVNYLAKHNHWTPMAHVNATFVIKAPLFVARQLGKHQVGLVWNEVSRRYVSDEPEFFIPASLRSAPGVDKKQGSGDVHKDSVPWLEFIGTTLKSNLFLYETLIDQGICPEQARMILPQNMMTEWWWTGSLAAWSRVFKLRLDPHTQQETRDVCRSMYELLLPSFPNALPALMNGAT
jgi:thymidylate synthase (FAD)